MQAPFDIAADLDTPVSAYLKLESLNPRFLLESVEGGERLARYSFKKKTGIKRPKLQVGRNRCVQIGGYVEWCLHIVHFAPWGRSYGLPIKEKPIPDFGRDGLLMFFAQLIASQQPPLVRAATTSC